MLSISPKPFQRISLSLVLAASLSMATALAQSGAAPDPPLTAPDSGEAHTMDHYLNNHPGVARELHNDPSLINNPQWLSQHPNVQNYMNSHPGLKADAAERPGEFINHTEHHDMVVDHRALNGTDAFMHDHPKVADELKNNPKLIDDPKYLAQHPQLDHYLASHPDVRREWQDHPEAFTKAAERNAKYDESHPRQARTDPKPVTARRK